MNTGKEEEITLEELKTNFSPINKSRGYEYSGKCRYCNVEVNFSDITQIKIKIEGKEGTRVFSLYHKGCYQRYMRRTID